MNENARIPWYAWLWALLCVASLLFGDVITG